MNFILFALFFISPASLFQDVEVTVFGKAHSFPNALFDQMELASPEDATTLANLSEESPSLYEKNFSTCGIFPFRRAYIYKRLLKGEVLEPNGIKSQHLFFVFKDPDGIIQGYIHGSHSLKNKRATIDELVVALESKKQVGKKEEVGRALLGRLLLELSRRGKSDVRLVTRDPLLQKLSRLYGIEPQQTGFDFTLLTDHLMSRFSLESLIKLRSEQVVSFSAIAKDIKNAIKRAKKKDGLRTRDAMAYLDSLAKMTSAEIERKYKQEGARVYIGIQFDKSELANIYFTMYLVSTLAKNDPKRKDRNFYLDRSYYFLLALYELSEAQREGGILPSTLQLTIARLHDFGRIFSNIKRGSQWDERRVQRTVCQYLRLATLKEIEGRPIIVGPAIVESAIREILLFRYAYFQADLIASKMKVALLAAPKRFKGQLSIRQRENSALEFFRNIQEELWQEHQIHLPFEYGFMYFYFLSVYPDPVVHLKLGRLFLLASFHLIRMDREKPLSVSRTLIRMLNGSDLHFLDGEEPSSIRNSRLSPSQRGTLSRLITRISRPIDKRRVGSEVTQRNLEASL